MGAGGSKTAAGNALPLQGNQTTSPAVNQGYNQAAYALKQWGKGGGKKTAKKTVKKAAKKPAAKKAPKKK